MDKPRCLWCHKYNDIMYEKLVVAINRLGFPKGQETEFFCSEDCFNKAEQFLGKCARYSLISILFLTLVLAGIFNSFKLARIFNIPNEYFLALLIFPVGLLLEWIPFTTPETIYYFGAKRGIGMTRGIGFFLIVLSIILVYVK